jgi:hypothetical protein
MVMVDCSSDRSVLWWLLLHLVERESGGSQEATQLMGGLIMWYFVTV